jgi:hypothetical protein
MHEVRGLDGTVVVFPSPARELSLKQRILDRRGPLARAREGHDRTEVLLDFWKV